MIFRFIVLESFSTEELSRDPAITIHDPAIHDSEIRVPIME